MPYIGEPYDSDYYHTFSKIRPEGYHDYSRYLDFAGGQNLWENIADDIEATTGLVSGKRVLDVGCAYGYLTNILTARGANVTGIDISAWAISRAKSLFPTLNFVEKDFLNNSFKVNAFDLSIVCGSLECMPSDSIIDSFLNEINRVTHPSGAKYFLIDYDETDPIYQNKTAEEWQGVIGGYDVQDVGHLPIYYKWRVVVL